MTLPQIIARNQIQKIPTVSINTRLVGASLIFYTCPTGKKASLKGSAIMTGLGAASEVRLHANGISIMEWTAVVIVPRMFEIGLAAGETLAKSQDSGTNGEVNVSAEVLETPA